VKSPEQRNLMITASIMLSFNKTASIHDHSFIQISRNGGTRMDDYMAEIYKGFIRPLIKNLAEQYLDDSDTSIESEIEYIRKVLIEQNQEWVLKDILNKDIFYRLILGRIQKPCKAEKAALDEYFETNFANIRLELKNDSNAKPAGDIIWLLYQSLAKYIYEKDSECLKDRSSFKQFGLLMNEMEFAEDVKNIFKYSDGIYYFNALPDNGKELYSQRFAPIVKYKTFAVVTQDDTNKAIFLNAAGGSDKEVMYDKLKRLLKLCYKTQKDTAIQQLDYESFLAVSENLSDLIPLIDIESKLKEPERLDKERLSVRLSVFNYYVKQRYSSSPKLSGNLLDFSKIYTVLLNLFDKIYEIKDFNEVQRMIITKGYFDSLKAHLDFFTEKVMQYQKTCEKLEGNPASPQKYNEMWEEVWTYRAEDE